MNNDVLVCFSFLEALFDPDIVRRTIEQLRIGHQRRRLGQLTIAPPGTYREPITRSESAVLAMSAGRDEGSWDRSASIWQIKSNCELRAHRKPSRYERPRPRRPVR